MKIHQLTAAGLLLEEEGTNILHVTEEADGAQLCLDNRQLDDAPYMTSHLCATLLIGLSHYAFTYNGAFEISYRTLEHEDEEPVFMTAVVCKAVNLGQDMSFNYEDEDTETALIAALEWFRKLA